MLVALGVGRWGSTWGGFLGRSRVLKKFFSNENPPNLAHFLGFFTSLGFSVIIFLDNLELGVGFGGWGGGYVDGRRDGWMDGVCVIVDSSEPFFVVASCKDILGF